MASVRTRRAPVTVALLVLVVGLLVALVVTWDPSARPGPELDGAAAEASSSQREVTRSASRQAEAFLEVDHRDMAGVTDRVLAGSTGAFRDQYAADLDDLTATVEAQQAVVDASLRAVGVVRSEADQAEVVVAADSVLRDQETAEEGVLRRHRLRLTMTLTDDGWRTSGLEFVR